VENRCTISLDSSGALLHKRGYRLATAKAPLRETLAAGILMASGWDLHSPLIDPFCGSGTIPIEAALMAGKIAPGIKRRFAFMDWPNFDRETWERLKAPSGQGPPKSVPRSWAPTGMRRHPGGGENAGRAGVAGDIIFSAAPFPTWKFLRGGAGW